MRRVALAAGAITIWLFLVGIAGVRHDFGLIGEELTEESSRSIASVWITIGDLNPHPFWSSGGMHWDGRQVIENKPQPKDGLKGVARGNGNSIVIILRRLRFGGDETIPGGSIFPEWGAVPWHGARGHVHRSFNAAYGCWGLPVIVEFQRNIDQEVLWPIGWAGEAFGLSGRRAASKLSIDPSPRKVPFGRLGLSVGFRSGFLSLPVTAETNDNSSHSADNGDKGKSGSDFPIEPFYPMVFALLGVPAFFYGLSRSNFWFAGPGFILGGIGAGIVLADWAICGFPLPF